jgi:hypothetical protein
MKPTPRFPIPGGPGRMRSPTLSAVVLVLELPILAVLVLAALITRTAARAAAVAAGLLRLSRREKIAT